MNKEEKKSLSVYLIACTVILSNLFVLSVIYQVPFLSGLPLIRKSLALLSLTAVYPFELFQFYFKEQLLMHFYWIMVMIICAFGLMMFNRFARIVFIVFNIIQLVFLMFLTIVSFGQEVFWDYAFKSYFNMVVFILYLGYLTMPDIREQFMAKTKETHFVPWFLKVKRKAVGPKDGIGYFNLALAYQKLGRMDEALDFLKRAIDILPDKSEAHSSVGQILFERREYALAIKSLQEAVRCDPINISARYLLGQAFSQTGCFEEAVQSFRRSTFLEPQKAEVFRSLGIASYHAGHWEEARQAFDKGAQLNPQDHQCPYFLGLIMSKDPQRRKNSEEQFKKATRLKPDFCEGYKELGHYYIGNGDYKAAVRAFRDVLRLDPQQSQAHYQLGFAYAMLKDFESARRVHRQLKDLDSDLAQTLEILLTHR